MKVSPIILQVSKEQEKTSRIESDIQPADDFKALAYRKDNMLMQLNAKGELFPYPFCVSLEELSKHGLGLQLYFAFLKSVTFSFTLMSFCAVACCVINILGDGMSEWKNLNALQLLSLGNQEAPSQNSLDRFYSDSSQYHAIITWLDFGSIVIFIIFWAIFSYWSDQIIKRYNSVSQVPSTFSIAVSGFESAEYETDDLKVFIEQYGTVKEVKFAKNYQNTLFLLKEEAELLVKIKTEHLKVGTTKEDPQKVEKLQVEMRKIQAKRNEIVNEKLGKLTRHDLYPTLFAFVIFETILDKQQFIETYQKRTDVGCCNCLCCEKEIHENDLFRKQYKLQIKQKVDNPSNIKWENLEVTTFQRFLRSFVVFFIVFLLMIITFVIVFGVNIVSKYSPQDCPTTSYSYAETQALIEQSTLESDRIQYQNCFCMKQNLTDLYLTYTSYCSDIIYQYTAVQALQIASALVIVIVNALLNYLMVSVSGFVRYPSVSRELSGTMIKIFVSLFINTALITLLLKASIFGFTLSLYLSSPIPPLQNAQKYDTFPSDFNREWYANVGAAYINTWVINIFSPYVLQFILLPLLRCWRKKKANEAISQRERNDYFVGPEFQLNQHYAYTLNTIFVTLFYSSAMPLMLPLGTLALVIQYITQKYLLLNFYRKPPSYDEALHKSAIVMLPFAAIFHVLVAIWVYGHPYIFPYDSSTLYLKTESTGTVIAVKDDGFWIRILNTPNLTILGLALLLILVLKIFLVDPLSYLFGLCISKDDNVEQAAIRVKYSEIEQDIAHHQLATYEIKENESYNDMIYTLDNSSKKMYESEKDDEIVPLKGKEQAMK